MSSVTSMFEKAWSTGVTIGGGIGAGTGTEALATGLIGVIRAQAGYSDIGSSDSECDGDIG